jgi:glucokinase
MPEKQTGVIGIDLGGTKTLFALFDEKSHVLEEVKEKTHAEKGVEKFEENWKAAIKKLLSRADDEKIKVVGVGVGCAGRTDRKKGVVEVSPNIPFLAEYPLRAKTQKIIDVPFALGNDVQTGLYGEMTHGAAMGFENVIGIFIGTGIGGALAIGGKIYKGATGLAGDIGHYLTDPMGPLAGSERRGTLDDIASRSAIAAAAAALAAKQWAPYLYKNQGTDVAAIKSGALFEAIKHGDEKIEELVRSRSRVVGIVLSNLVDFLSPDLIVLGGGVVDEMPEIIVKEVEKGVKEYSVPEMGKHVKIVATALRDHAITTGAAQMAWDLIGSEKAVELERLRDS